jgi:hypothetical protein
MKMEKPVTTAAVRSDGVDGAAHPRLWRGEVKAASSGGPNKA